MMMGETAHGRNDTRAKRHTGKTTHLFNKGETTVGEKTHVRNDTYSVSES